MTDLSIENYFLKPISSAYTSQNGLNRLWELGRAIQCRQICSIFIFSP